MKKSSIKREKFQKALEALERIYLIPSTEDRAYIDATIQRFEFTFELAWKWLKDYLFEQGLQLHYPKEVLQQAYQSGLITEQEQWLSMLQDRNMTPHSYDEKLADEIHSRVKIYVPKLRQLLNTIDHH